MPSKGDFGFGSTPIVFKSTGCARSWSRRGQGRRALSLEARDARPRARCSGSSWPSRPRSTARPPGIPRRSSCSSRPRRATPASRRGSTRSRVTRACKLRRAWTQGPRRSAQRHPDGRQQHGHRRHRAPGTCASTPPPTGRLIAKRELRGAAFAAPIAIGRDVAVVTWTRKLMVYRLPPPARAASSGPRPILRGMAVPVDLPAIAGGQPVRGERRLDFAPPALGDEERANVLRSLETGWLTTGPFARQLESEFARLRRGARWRSPSRRARPRCTSRCARSASARATATRSSRRR